MDKNIKFPFQFFRSNTRNLRQSNNFWFGYKVSDLLSTNHLFLDVCLIPDMLNQPCSQLSLLVQITSNLQREDFLKFLQQQCLNLRAVWESSNAILLHVSKKKIKQFRSKTRPLFFQITVFTCFLSPSVFSIYFCIISSALTWYLQIRMCTILLTWDVLAEHNIRNNTQWLPSSIQLTLKQILFKF